MLDGEVRIARGSPQGRSLEPYRVGIGDSCVVTTSCLVGRHSMADHGVKTRPTRLLALSPTAFDAWCAHEGFRRFVLGVFAERLATALRGHGPVAHLSHQALADQLAPYARSSPGCSSASSTRAGCGWPARASN